MSVLATLLRFQSCRNMTPSIMRQATRHMSSSFGPASRSFRHRSALSSTRLSSLSFNASRSFSSSSLLWNDASDAQRPPLEHQPSSTIYVGNVPYTASTEEIREMFGPFGAIKNIRMKYDGEGRNLGYAHIDFVTEADAVAAVESAQQEPFWLINRTLMVNFAKPGMIRKTRTRPPPRPSNKLFFNEFDGTTNDLREGLKKYSKSIIRIDFHKDKETGELLNRGHITFFNEENATTVLNEMNDFVTDSGFKLQLNYSY